MPMDYGRKILIEILNLDLQFSSMVCKENFFLMDGVTAVESANIKESKLVFWRSSRNS